MNVLLIMDPLIPVPPLEYGGIERVVADVANGLTERGHRIELWAAPGSRTAAQVRTFGKAGEWTLWSNLRNTGVVTARLLHEVQRFDVVHNFGRLAYLTGILRNCVPKVQTYMRPVNANNMRRVVRLGASNLHFTAVSAVIRDTGTPGGGSWSVIYNCAQTEKYQPRYALDATAAPLVFLGRLERCKGAHTAMTVAEKLGRRLYIAGNISDIPAEREYFYRELYPRINGKNTVYVGPVNDAQKAELLASAAALLLPIEWDEPFPVVLPESLLCGTPVIGFRLGGLPEGIEDGRTGFLCDTVDDMVAAVQRLPELSRRECRRTAEQRFSADVVVGEYETLYHRLLALSGRCP